MLPCSFTSAICLYPFTQIPLTPWLDLKGKVYYRSETGISWPLTSNEKHVNVIYLHLWILQTDTVKWNNKKRRRNGYIAIRSLYAQDSAQWSLYRLAFTVVAAASVCLCVGLCVFLARGHDEFFFPLPIHAASSAAIREARIVAVCETSLCVTAIRYIFLL